MVKRSADLILAFLALLFLGPIILLAAAGIRFSSPGPVLFRAKRVGFNGNPFTMYKLRTMHVASGSPSGPITAAHDPRVFAFGALLRKWKIDELPQLFNVLKGEMSLVGPRPEDPEIVRKYYSPAHHQTFRVLPGLASPGSIYNYTHGERTLGANDTERRYGEQLLPVKLALDLVYVREASLFYDVRIILRTVKVIISIALGATQFPDPPEMNRISQIHS
jgi:lipopolysaccharide/colanic/teichoic acid biosynthesis glycosyltransferase